MKNNNLTAAWQQYELGKNYKRSAGIYGRIDENERFYRGDQWRGANVGGIPTPVFNVIRRIVDYLVSTVMSYDIGIRYEDVGVSKEADSRAARNRLTAMDTLNRVVSTMWTEADMDSVLRSAVYDAALSGDGFLYCYYDKASSASGVRSTDIVTKTVDNVNVFAADMNNPDIQSQEYIILCGRASVDQLKKEARMYGADSETLKKIEEDNDRGDLAGDFSSIENNSGLSGKATYLVRFSRNSSGFVVWEKYTKFAKISSATTSMRRYPLTYFSWEGVKGSFHGETPVSELIQNQKYINKSYALSMKHMIDTAFSKVIYDKRLIPEWDNEVGQAIGVMSSGDVSGAATVIGVGQMQENFLEILESVIKNTKEMSGATEVALGEVDPTNTSAILALRETSELSLDRVRSGINSCIRELAMIWLEMMKEYYGKEQSFYAGDSTPGSALHLNFERIQPSSIVARVESGATRRFSKSVMISTLSSLLAGGHITFAEYLERIPAGVIDLKDALLERARSEISTPQESSKATKEHDDGKKEYLGQRIFTKKEVLGASQVNQYE